MRKLGWLGIYMEALSHAGTIFLGELLCADVLLLGHAGSGKTNTTRPLDLTTNRS
jgi:hypothetical protein